ncbi:MAG: hypothetical protein NTY12_01620 [Candidatus Falkowbacteria bacterium]|nr:hypothetical protein [Candidatus Falkowbacteria bacterium]
MGQVDLSNYWPVIVVVTIYIIALFAVIFSFSFLLGRKNEQNTWLEREVKSLKAEIKSDEEKAKENVKKLVKIFSSIFLFKENLEKCKSIEDAYEVTRNLCLTYQVSEFSFNKNPNIKLHGQVKAFLEEALVSYFKTNLLSLDNSELKISVLTKAINFACNNSSDPICLMINVKRVIGNVFMLLEYKEKLDVYIAVIKNQIVDKNLHYIMDLELFVGYIKSDDVFKNKKFHDDAKVMIDELTKEVKDPGVIRFLEMVAGLTGVKLGVK